MYVTSDSSIFTADAGASSDGLLLSMQMGAMDVASAMSDLSTQASVSVADPSIVSVSIVRAVGNASVARRMVSASIARSAA